jgi:(+)-trans-carveol dehydrogenase
MGKLDGKVAFITGAARGQGRSHAVRLAEEGADIIASDICAQIDSVPYELGTADQLAETAKLVEQLGRRIIARPADVRDRASLQAVVDEGIGELGRLDIVVANAGIWSSFPFVDMPDEAYHDLIDVMLHGPYNTCKVTVPHLIQQGSGGSIVIISSAAGLKGFPNQVHYVMAKHGLVGLMRALANELAPQFIRVNTVHPSTVNTKMINHPAIWSVFAPGVENPTEADFGDTFTALNLLPIPWMEPIDISNAVAWLASDESRYVTGVTLPVDAGFAEKV